jgi:hypothetical protein
MSSTQS